MRAPLLALFVAAAVTAGPAPVHAEWLFTPFAGVTAGRTGYFDPDDAASRRKPVFGVAVTRTWGRFAVEGELAAAPGFFTAGADGLITSSSLVSVSGNAIANLPSLGRLRPYAVAGVGATRIRIEDAAHVFSVSEWKPVLNVGGGLLLPITDRFGVRGDARYAFSLRGAGADSSIGFGTTYVDYWRVTAGLTIALR